MKPARGAPGRISPESVTSTKNGTLYVASLGRNGTYRAAAKLSKADIWIPYKAPK
jgi:hypothetical protein